MTEPGQSAEEMDHLTTDCAKASSGHPSAENDAESAEIQIERKCDWLLRELDELCALASNHETSDLIEGQKIAVGMMQTRVQLILSFLLARHPSGLRLIKNG